MSSSSSNSSSSASASNATTLSAAQIAALSAAAAVDAASAAVAAGNGGKEEVQAQPTRIGIMDRLCSRSATGNALYPWKAYFAFQETDEKPAAYDAMEAAEDDEGGPPESDDDGVDEADDDGASMEVHVGGGKKMDGPAFHTRARERARELLASRC